MRTGGVELAAELLRRPEVVVVEEREPGRTREADPQVARPADAVPLLEADDADALVAHAAEHRRRLVRRRIVDDDQLDGHRLLTEHRGDTAGQIVGAVPGRDDDGDVRDAQRRSPVRVRANAGAA